MPNEETITIQRLLDPQSSAAQQRAALRWLADYLEQGYILNLRPSRDLLRGLEDFAAQPQSDAALKKRAANLHKKYRPR